MAKLQVIYEEGDEYTSEPGKARVRLMKTWDPDNYPLYILESWLTGEPGYSYDLDAGRDVPYRQHVQSNREALDRSFALDSQAIRAAIAKFDGLAHRYDALR